MLAEPVLVDGEVVGAVVTVSPTDALRAEAVRTWSLIAGAAVFALLAGTLVALPLTAWVLRPVRRLDEAMDRVGTAVLAGAARSAVAAQRLRRSCARWPSRSTG